MVDHEEQVKDEVIAFEYEWRHGSRTKARHLAAAFVAQRGKAIHETCHLGWYSREGLVALVDSLREAGREIDRIIADMWLLVHFGPPASRLMEGAEPPSLAVDASNEELAAFVRQWRRGDRGLAGKQAAAFVAMHVDELHVLERYTLEDLVDLIDRYRHHHKTRERLIVEIWLLARYEPQQISGRLDLSPKRIVEAAMRQLAR